MIRSAVSRAVMSPWSWITPGRGGRSECHLGRHCGAAPSTSTCSSSFQTLPLSLSLANQRPNATFPKTNENNNWHPDSLRPCACACGHTTPKCTQGCHTRAAGCTSHQPPKRTLQKNAHKNITKSKQHHTFRILEVPKRTRWNSETKLIGF